MNFIFDFDGTIVDSLEAFIAVFNKHVRDNKEPLSPKEIERFRMMNSRKALRTAGVRWWQIPKLIIRGIPDFQALLPGLHPFATLPDVIRQLHERGDKLFIVTSNTHESVETFLRQHKLDKYFSGMDTAAGLFSKSKHIRNMIKVYRLKNKDTFYVGDETRDIQAGKRARIKVVSVTWGFNHASALKKYRPAYIIDEPKDLLKVQ